MQAKKTLDRLKMSSTYNAFTNHMYEEDSALNKQQ